MPLVSMDGEEKYSSVRVRATLIEVSSYESRRNNTENYQQGNLTDAEHRNKQLETFCMDNGRPVFVVLFACDPFVCKVGLRGHDRTT
eukprot:g29441.t1